MFFKKALLLHILLQLKAITRPALAVEEGTGLIPLVFKDSGLPLVGMTEPVKRQARIQHM
jgi:hypothetical protein